MFNSVEKVDFLIFYSSELLEPQKVYTKSLLQFVVG